MSIVSVAILSALTVLSLSSTIDILSWESYLELGSIEQPLGLVFNGSSLAHRHFLIGYLCLNSFMYDTAQEAFQLAIDVDPTLVEAHIGRLMGHKQALWSYTNRSGALELWNNTWSVFDEYNVSLTPFQSMYIQTTYQWFLPENTTDGEEAFLNGMLNLTKEFPLNNDARTLLGLAYLNKAQSESVQLQIMESSALLTARKILQAALILEPTHPGCLHYLIHAFDIPQPEVALQAVPYAHKYGQVALTASHAQHMPTHIWTRIGAWSLAQVADAKSIEVSLILCIKKQQLANGTQLSTNEISSLTLTQLVSHLNLTQSQNLLGCDRDNRAHSQEWLVYSYLQTGRYRKSINVLSDLILSNQIFPFDNYYIPYIYGARAHIAINVFFWAMYEKENNQEVFVRTVNELLVDMDSTPIQSLNDNITDGSFFASREVVARFVECIRLLLVNANDTTNTTSIEHHLARMMEIYTTIKSAMEPAAIRILIIISQVKALGWCLNGSMMNCLLELDNATQMELSIANDYNRPYVLHSRASELLAFYLLITHRSYSSLASIYALNHSTVAITDFPSYALRLYTKVNQTDPYRGVNLLGMARAYSQMGRTEQASQIYEKFLRDWSDSTFSSAIDRLVIREATDYLLAVKVNQTRSDGCMIYSSLSLIILLNYHSIVETSQ